MIKTVTFAALALTVSAFAVSANAQDAAPTAAPKGYFQVGAANANFSGDNFAAVEFGVGFNLSKHFAVEADGDVGVSDKTYRVSGVDVKAKLDYAVGAFVVGTLPVSANVDLLGRVGYVKAQIKASAGGYSATGSNSGAAYGVGVRYFPNGGINGVRADVTHFDLGSDSSGELYQVSFIRKF